MSANLDKNTSRRKGIVWSSVATVVLMAVTGVLYFNIPAADVNLKTELDATNETFNSSNNSTKEFKIEKVEDGSTGRAENSNQEFLQLSSTKSQQERISKTPEVMQPSIAKASGVVLEESNSASNELYNEFLNIKDFDIVSKGLNSKPLNDWLTLSLPLNTLNSRSHKIAVSPWGLEVGYDQNQTKFNYQVATSQEKYVHKNYLNRMREGEFSLSAPQVHTAIRYDFNNHWHASVGLGFAQTRTTQIFNFRDSVPVSVAQGQEADGFGNYPIFGYMGLGQQIDYNGIQTVNMVSIPFNIGYNHELNRLWSLSVEGSARYNLISNSVGKTLNYHTLELMNVDQQVYRNSLITARFAAGLERRLSLKKWFGLRINTQGSLTPLFKQDAAVQNRGWSVGLSAHYYWKLF